MENTLRSQAKPRAHCARRRRRSMLFRISQAMLLQEERFLFADAIRRECHSLLSDFISAAFYAHFMTVCRLLVR